MSGPESKACKFMMKQRWAGLKDTFKILTLSLFAFGVGTGENVTPLLFFVAPGAPAGAAFLVNFAFDLFSFVTAAREVSLFSSSFVFRSGLRKVLNSKTAAAASAASFDAFGPVAGGGTKFLRLGEPQCPPRRETSPR